MSHGAAIAPDYIYAEANAGRMGAKLMAIVAEGERGRVYLSPLTEHEAIAQQANLCNLQAAPLSKSENRQSIGNEKK